MANGPMGGFMPTPAAPAQPPQVKLDSTAISRSNFNNFLKNMNGATSLNPPSMAPMVGAAAPSLAPTMSDIDIFNPPVQNFFFGGGVDDFSDSDFGGFSDYGSVDAPSVDDSFNENNDDNQQSTVDDDPVAGFDFDPVTGSFDVVTTPTITQDEQDQNIQDAEDFIVGTTTFPSGQNFGASPNINLTGDVLEDI